MPGVLIEGADLDRVAPFGVLCDSELVITRTGPSWSRLAPDFVGLPLLEVFDLVRPAGIDSVEGLRRHRDSMLLLRLKPRGPRVRFQVIDVSAPEGVMLVGTPVVSSSEELDRLGLSAADFSPIDQTPDLLLLRRGQERSLADLRTLNTELQRSSSELRRTNKMLSRAEARYRRLVELQPLIMYIDTLGAVPLAEFMSAQAEAWFGYPVERWMKEPGFFFDIVHPDDRERVLEAHLRAERDDSGFDEELRVRRADGGVMWIRAVDSVVRDDDDGTGQRIGFMLDITSAKTAELELQSTMSRLTTLLAHMQTGVLVEDAERRVVMANDTLCEVFGVGVKPGDLATLPASAAIAALLPGSDAAADFLVRTDDLIHKRWPQPGQTLVLADGRVLEFDFQPITSERRDLGALWMFRDATSRVQYQEALERAAAEALAASDAKTQFLASMSHEIRTPMHGVLATLDLLRLTPLDSEQRELVEVVNSSASSLIEIINDILDFERVEAGRIELVDEPFSPAEVLTGIVGLLRPQARAKGLEIGAVLGPDLPELVLGDALRLRQVVLNLAGNAVKFTPSGRVTLSCTVVGRSAGAVSMTFEVHDSGQGIAADRLGTIFDPFVQAKRSDEGTGLGLAISDRLVTLMGGQFQVTSTVGVGSTFRFTLELPEVSGAPTGVATAAVPEEVAAGDTVLVVDDSDASRNLVLRQLSRLGVTARGASSGQEALELLESSRAFGLVLLDADMPDLDGPATSDRIRSSQRRAVASVPVIGLVVGDDADWLARCRAARMDGHLSKPVDLAELRRVVDELLAPGPERR
ncbi:MAG TPA: ATP-binding protein [Candidatus Nanopelagicales bacterium]|nr:ATP-binding protein [Candidatus Nanopelagicales bacterium]